MPSLDDLEPLLRSLWNNKPPGVAKSKIETATAIAAENVQSEATLVQQISNHYENTPATHKLGVLYVLDSVTRQWVDRARQTGQALTGSAAAPGTFAGGVHRATEILPSIMHDLIRSAPSEQKERITKLIDIWERGNTFPAPMLASFKQQLIAQAQNTASVAVPNAVLSQPPNVGGIVHESIIQSQVNGQSSGAVVPLTGRPEVSVSHNTTGLAVQAPAPKSVDPRKHVSQQQPVPQPSVSAQASQTPAAPLPVAYSNGNTNGASGFSSSVSSVAGFTPASGGSLPTVNGTPAQHPSFNPASNAMQNDLNAKMQIIQGLLASGLPPETMAQALQLMGLPQPPAPPAIPMTQPVAASMPSANDVVSNGYSFIQPDDRRQEQQQEFERYQPRPRSRSPDRKRRRFSPLNRRESPTYGIYDPTATSQEVHQYAENDRHRNNRGGRNRGNKPRSPPDAAKERAISPTYAPRNMQPKFIAYEELGPGNIKVLSRTLFVGGVNTSEPDLHAIFSRFGKVQSCIVNQDKRHAFVKMVDRPNTLLAKAGMEKEDDPEVLNKARSTKWGVGFGPRECADYTTGISVIPIKKLTDADRKWLLTAEFGGTGGRPLEPGMVLEEPDIEIGAGVSSKAISRRIESGAGSGGGKHSGKKFQQRQRTPQQQQPPRFQHREKKENRRPSPRRAAAAEQANQITAPPIVPSFGFQLPDMSFR